MSLRSFIQKISLSLGAFAACLVLVELGLRVYAGMIDEAPAAPVFQEAPTAFAPNETTRHRETRAVSGPPPLHILKDGNVLYGLNPAHPDINAQGLRDDEVAAPKPAGKKRILVLGDSVAFGISVAMHETFPNRLETLLRQSDGDVEVINAGVSGYTTYNELQYYLGEGRRFEADVVLLAVCLNDVVNPRLHWNYAKEKIRNIPDDAIPNHDYDRRHILPKLSGRRPRTEKATANSSGSKLVSFVRERVENAVTDRNRGFESGAPGQARDDAAFGRRVKRDEWRNVPTYLTGEDTIGIDVLLDRSSAEWRWLARMFDRLKAAVEADGARLIIAVLPLAYQMDDGYPFMPQQHFMRYCAENHVACIDLLDAFGDTRKEDVFLLHQSPYYDIWHLTTFGHALTAKVLAAFIRDRKMLAR